MSVSKWRYTEECNGRPCPGDCDHCSFEPTDLISRADAIEALRGLFDMRKSRAKVIVECFGELLNALPSADTDMSEYCDRLWKIAYERGKAEAEAVQGWIPCSERLPEDGQGVIVTVDDNVYEIKVGSCIYSNGRFHSLYNDLTVTAWMPLPEPYKGGDDE